MNEKQTDDPWSEWDIPPERVRELREREEAEERRRARELFGDRKPFAVPEGEADS
jgi:hypothetical protein